MILAGDIGRPKSRRPAKTWKSAVRLIVLAVTFGSSWIIPDGVRAQDKTEITIAEAGRIGYDKYCTPCHGPGGAPGSAVYRNTKQPIDLRTYVQRHGGQFPLGKWLAVVFGSQPRGPHTEVWEKIRSAHHTTSSVSDAEARDLVDDIEDYVILVQQRCQRPASPWEPPTVCTPASRTETIQ